MTIARVIRHEIDEHADTTLGGRRDERVELGERTERGIDAAVIGDVVSPIFVRRRMDRREPDRVDTEPGEMVELPGDAAEVADAVTVRVGERSNVDLIDDG